MSILRNGNVALSILRVKGPCSVLNQMTKTCWGNIGTLFVICMREVTKGHLYHLLGVSDYYVMYRQRAKSVL